MQDKEPQAALVSFVSAHLQDELASAQNAPQGRWLTETDHPYHDGSIYREVTPGFLQRVIDGRKFEWDDDQERNVQVARHGSAALVAHLVRHDPSRTVREITYAIKVVEEYASLIHVPRPGDYVKGRMVALHFAVASMAVRWNDAPGYRAYWLDMKWPATVIADDDGPS